jgi:long-chain acyl-CoA synthetase
VLPLLPGCSSYLLERFSPAGVLRAVAEGGVTVFPGVPAMFGALLQVPASARPGLPSLRFCVSGAAPMPVEVMEAFEREFKTILLEGDGPTECSPVTCVNPYHGPRKAGSVGLPLPGVEIRIFDAEDRELPAGEVGEVVVRGENVMRGYHNRPEDTAAALRGGWFHTGDLGRFDAEGYLYLVDRKKDLIIVGGLNVYPREVELTLLSHPAVAEAAVVAIADEARGEVPAAFVALRRGEAAAASELIRHCRERLANFKVPRAVHFLDSLPKTGTGKLRKEDLRPPPRTRDE